MHSLGKKDTLLGMGWVSWNYRCKIVFNIFWRSDWIQVCRIW